MDQKEMSYLNELRRKSKRNIMQLMTLMDDLYMEKNVKDLEIVNIMIQDIFDIVVKEQE